MLVIYYSEIRYKIGFFLNRQCRHKEIFLSQQLFKGVERKPRALLYTYAREQVHS